jgi:hypothetical protein
MAGTSTHCSKGHPWRNEFTYWPPNKYHQRECVECQLDRQLKLHAAFAEKWEGLYYEDDD